MNCIKDFRLEKIDKKYYLFFPNYKIENYEELTIIIGKILGKYAKYKKQHCFLFETNPAPYLAQIEKGIYPDIKKDHQFFETPKEVWFQVFDKIAYAFKPYIKILEPSAGRGGLISSLAEWHISNYSPLQFFTYQIHLIENYESNRFFLEEKCKTYQAMRMYCAMMPDLDFLKTNIKNKYDLILANPPFNKGQAEKHLEKMLLHLKEDGVLAIILPQSIKYTDIFKKCKNDYFNLLFDLKSGDFKKSGTNIQCCVLVLSKKQILDIKPPKPYVRLCEGDDSRIEFFYDIEDKRPISYKDITDADVFYLPEKTPEKVIAHEYKSMPKQIVSKKEQLVLLF